MSSYATLITVVPRESKEGTPLAETKLLVIDYRELIQQIPKVKTTQAKSKGSLALIETTKIDHIWSELKEVTFFTIPEIGSGYNHISIHPDLRPMTAFICLYW